MPPADCTLEPEDLLDLLSSLVDKSLVIYEEDEQGRGRYSMLETVRQYGASRLRESGEAEAVRGRHRDEFLRLAERAKPEMQGPEQTAWLDRLETESDNLRAALDWCLEEPAGAEPGLRLASDLFFLWWIRGYFTEGQGHYDAVLGRSGAEARTAARAKALSRAGSLFSIRGDLAAAAPLFEEGLAIARDLGDRKAEANLLCNLGDIALHTSPATARTALEQSLAIHREMENRSGIAHASLLLGNVALRQDQPIEAWALYAESLALNRALGNPQKTGHALWCLARCSLEQGQYIEARSLVEECVMLFRQLKDPWGLSAALALAGDVAIQEKEYGRAEPLLAEHLRLVVHMGLRRAAPWGLRCFGRFAAARAQWVRHACLFGAAQALEETRTDLSPTEESARQEARAALGAAQFESAWSAGRAMSLEQATEYALTGKE